MRLTGLVLRHFRNLHPQSLDIPREGLALVGDNAQGKSSFLEAVYYLETFRSFRGARDEDLIEFGRDVFRVAGSVIGPDGEGSTEVSAAFAREGRRKKVTLGGVEPDRLGDALGSLGAVVFSPADLDMVAGGPSERRRFLDIVLSLNDDGYLSSIQEYRRSLARRNAALRAGQPRSVVAAWDEGLVRAGARVLAARAAWVTSSSSHFTAYFEAVSGGESAGMRYRSTVCSDGRGGEASIREVFLDALTASVERERRQGATVVGPHRDDLVLDLGDATAARALRTYGSGGQRRTAALALRLVEARTVRERRGCRPMLLLDDVFAELDEGRSERVLALMDSDEVGQVFLTAPKPGDVRLRPDSLPRWRIRGGEIES